MPVEWTERDAAASEAFAHGRTQVKLESARAALEEILEITKGRIRYVKIASIAKTGLALSDQREGDKHA